MDAQGYVNLAQQVTILLWPAATILSIILCLSHEYMSDELLLKRYLKGNEMKAIELKAINWFCIQYDLKPALSVPPFQMHFTDKKTGLDKTCHLDNVMQQYRAWNKEDQKRRARERRLLKKK